MSSTKANPVRQTGGNNVPLVVPDQVLTSEDQMDGNTAANPAQGETPRTIRHAHLYVTRLDPWSVMKNAFMLSVAIAIVIVVAVTLLWMMLTVSGTLASLTRTVSDVAGTGAASIDLAGLFSFGRVFSTVAIISFMEIILVSALATLFAYLYNLGVAITGGLQITLTEDS